MDDDQLRDMAASACQEALSFGVNEYVFMRLARSVRAKCSEPGQPLGLALTDQLGLVERLRARRMLANVGYIGEGRSNARLTWVTAEPDPDCAAAADEIERLQADSAALAAELRGAHTLFACLCRDFTALTWLERAEALLKRLKA